jgi:hypothetical protein
MANAFVEMVRIVLRVRRQVMKPNTFIRAPLDLGVDATTLADIFWLVVSEGGACGLTLGQQAFSRRIPAQCPACSRRFDPTAQRLAVGCSDEPAASPCPGRRTRRRRRACLVGRRCAALASLVQSLPGAAASSRCDRRVGAEGVGRSRSGAVSGCPCAPGRYRRFGQRQRGESADGQPAAPAAVCAAPVLPERRLRP